MTGYFLIISLYIITQIISLLLLALLIILLLRTKSHFTKWTLFQLFISAFGNGISALPPIIMYGDDLINRAFDSPACLISNKISASTIFPLETFPLVIAFYLWHVLVMNRLDIEKKCFWYVSGAIWLYNIVYNVINLLYSRQYPNWGIRVTTFNCKASVLTLSYYGTLIPTTMIVVITIILACKNIRTCFYLFFLQD